MSLKRQKKYMSHLPVLKLIFEVCDIKTVFEYGCGIHSTSFFLEHSEFVTSVEMNHLKWYDKLKSEMKSDKLDLSFRLTHEAIDYFKSTNKNYDLIFVDGDRDLRKECVITAVNKTDIITLHDVDLTWRRFTHKGWLKVNDEIPENYRIITMQLENPSTTVYTSNLQLFDFLKQYNSTVIR